MSPNRTDDPFIQLLRRELWIKEYGNAPLQAEKWMGKAISDKIEIAIGAELEAKNMGKGAPHPDTIVNFLNRNTRPSKRLLDTLAWYLRGDPEHFVSFEAYKRLVEEAGNLPPAAEQQFPATERKRWEKFGLLLLLVLAIGLLSKVYFGKRDTQEFFMRFTTSNLDSLEKGGWFLHSDSIDQTVWNNPEYRDSPYLVMETYLGDHWLYNPDYDPQIANILTRPVSCGDCCEIEVKIVNFNPYQRYQQAGVFFFEDEDILPNVRYTLVGTNGGYLRVQAAGRTAKYMTEEYFSILDPQYSPRLIVSTYDTNKVAGARDQYLNPIDSIILNVIFDGEQFFYKHRSRDSSYTLIGNSPTPIEDIQYIGLAAFQGRPDIPSPVRPIADTIPAFFEYVKLTKCPY